MSVRSVVIAESDYVALRTGLFTPDGMENAALLMSGRSATARGTRLLVREVLAVPRDAYVERLPYHLEIAPRFINDAISMCLAKGFGIVVVHSHRGAGRASYSISDDHGERRLFRVFSDLLGDGRHASLLLTEHDLVGRTFVGDREVSIETLSIVGNRTQELRLSETGSDQRPSVAESQRSRERLAFGGAGQRRISRLRVGVVGLGGTGSAIVEQLARLGVEHFECVDQDKFEPSNLSRTYGSYFKDTRRKGLSKTAIASRLATSVNPEAHVEGIKDNIVRQSVLMQLRDCDVIFSCTDNDLSRAALNRMAYQYLIPLIDLGIRITTSEGSVTGVGGRVARVGPDAPCLRCAHHLDPERIRVEAMPPEQRVSLLREHYITGIDDPVPAVISYNTTVASLAVSELLDLLLGIGIEGRPNELIYDGLEGNVFRARTVSDPHCDICSVNGLKATGDLQIVSAYS